MIKNRKKRQTINNTTVSNKKKDQEPTEWETIVAKRTKEQHSMKNQKFSFVDDPFYSVPLKIAVIETKLKVQT